MSQILDQTPASPAFYNFITQMVYCPAAQTTHRPLGTTWFELYIAYKLAGHPDPLPHSISSSIARPSLRQQLHAFRSGVRGMVRLTFPTSLHKFFKGGACKGKRLQGLGINTYLPILPLHPSLKPVVRQHLLLQLGRSQHHVAQDKLRTTITPPTPSSESTSD